MDLLLYKDSLPWSARRKFEAMVAFTEQVGRADCTVAQALQMQRDVPLIAGRLAKRPTRWARV